MDGVKKIREGKLIGCGGWLRDREESSSRSSKEGLWKSIHFGGEDVEFVFEHGSDEVMRQLIRSRAPLSLRVVIGHQ